LNSTRRAHNGAGVIEMQDTTAFQLSRLRVNWVFGVSGEDINKNHFGGAGRFITTLRESLAAAWKTRMWGNSQALTFTGSSTSIAVTGRAIDTITFTGAPAPNTYAGVRRFRETKLFIISWIRARHLCVSSGQAFAAAERNVLERVAQRHTACSTCHGALPTGGTTYQIGLATADGRGNITVVRARTRRGVIGLNQPGNVSTYSVAATGRTTFAAEAETSRSCTWRI